MYALLNLKYDMAIVHKRANIILINDGVRYVLDRDAHVFIAVEKCAKIYFLEVGSHQSGNGC